MPLVGMLVSFRDLKSYAVGSLVLLVGPPKAERSTGRRQTKSSLLVLQVGGWAMG